MLSFEHLEITPAPTFAEAAADGDLLLANGWSLADGEIANLSLPIQWKGHSRSFEFHLQAWQPVQRLLTAFDLSEDRKYFDAAFAMAMDWLRAVEVKPQGRPLQEAVAEVLSLDDDPWWYDMAVAQRLQRLSYLIDVASRLPDVTDDQIAIMIEQALLHHAVLRHEKLFRSETNHGFFQALNQLAAVRRFPEFDPGGKLLALSQVRLAKMVTDQFNSEAIHKEHSPGYHLMVTVALANAHRCGLLTDGMASVWKSAAENLGWMISPSGMIACIGDTDVRRLCEPTMERPFAEELSLLETIRLSDSAPFGVRAYPVSGYALARLHAPGVEPLFKNASYLAQMAAFHSRVHKHSDHLSFIWHDLGRDILIDPGRYAYSEKTEPGSDLFEQGFWYSDPKRVYVESTRAHNCVEVDGRSYPRKGVKPFGSALRYAGEQNGLAVTDCELTQLRAVRHRRVLVMAPGHFLLVVDWLNDRNESHDYRQWFQFAPEWLFERSADGALAISPGSESMPAASMAVLNLIDENQMGALAFGQEKPELQGWHSNAPNSLVPSASLPVNALSRKMGRFATLIVLDGTARLDKKSSRFNTTLRNGTVGWSDEKGKHRLTLTLAEPGNVVARIEIVSKNAAPIAGETLRAAAANLSPRRLLKRIFHYLRP